MLPHIEIYTLLHICFFPQVCGSVSELESLFQTTLYHIQEQKSSFSTSLNEEETFLEKISKQVESLIAFKMISDGTPSDINSRENTQENSAELQPRVDGEKKIADEAVPVASPSKLVITDLGRATVKGTSSYFSQIFFIFLV